jgi:hypothetical protein
MFCLLVSGTDETYPVALLSIPRAAESSDTCSRGPAETWQSGCTRRAVAVGEGEPL